MSTVASITLAVLYIVIHAVMERWAQQRHAIVTKAQAERIKALENEMKLIQDAISASPFVQYPYIYTNATRKY